MILTEKEKAFVLSSPQALEIAADYHDSQICMGEPMGFDCSAHEARRKELLEAYQRHIDTGEWNPEGTA